MHAGDVIAGKYRLQELLGSGGMASVWSAVNVFTERTFAIKFMLPQVARTPEAARRFLMEAKVSARIDHPNIIEVIDVGQTEDGTLFLVMELLSGVSLDVALRHKRPPLLVHEFAAVMLDVARALAAAHKRGVIHRDLKPSNVFLHRDKNGLAVPKLLDFGVSKFLEDEGQKLQGLTLAGTVLGSPLYMSPEQARGETEVDGRTDIFAFGGICFEALTGYRAYEGTNFNKLIVTIATSEPKRIDDCPRPIPESLKSLIRSSLVVDVERRLGSFERVVGLLEAALPELERSPQRLPGLPALEGTPAFPGDAEVPPIRTSQARASEPSFERKPDGGPQPSDSGATGAANDRVGSSPAVAPVGSPGLSASTNLGPTASGAAFTLNDGPSPPQAWWKRSSTWLGLGAALSLAGIGAIALTMRQDSKPESTSSHTLATSGAQLDRLPTSASGNPTPEPPGPIAAPSSDVPVVSVDSLPHARTQSTSPARGRLSIDALPHACQVTVDGVSRGATPLFKLELGAGPHAVACDVGGGRVQKATLNVPNGNAIKYTFDTKD